MKKGPTKEKTRKTIGLLEKAGRKGKSAFWLDIAERIAKPRRQRPDVNMWKLDKIARIFKGKGLLVPGKVLGNGQLGEKVTVVALEFSESAREKISKRGGRALSIEEALEAKIEPKALVIVK